MGLNGWTLLSPTKALRIIDQDWWVASFDKATTTPFYASTPPLEALRTIVSHAATHDAAQMGKDIGQREVKHVMVNDVRRAYFHIAATRDLYIELLIGNTFGSREPQLGKLHLSLYGTRDAACNRQETLPSLLATLGFRRGIGHPSMLVRADRQIWTLVHGDDYVSSGCKSDLQWLRQQLEQKYELKSQMMGSRGLGVVDEGKVLNIILRWSEQGWQTEADPRHGDLVAEQLGVQQGKGLSTPGNDDDEDVHAGDDEELAGDDITLFRGLAARCNSMAQDRLDLQYAAKEICRETARTMNGSLRKLTRLAK